MIVLTQVVSGAVTVAGAAERLRLSQRQVKRLLAGFRRDGGPPWSTAIGGDSPSIRSVRRRATRCGSWRRGNMSASTSST